MQQAAQQRMSFSSSTASSPQQHMMMMLVVVGGVSGWSVLKGIVREANKVVPCSTPQKDTPYYELPVNSKKLKFRARTRSDALRRAQTLSERSQTLSERSQNKNFLASE
jgi:hypothetical protein